MAKKKAKKKAKVTPRHKQDREIAKAQKKAKKKPTKKKVAKKKAKKKRQIITKEKLGPMIYGNGLTALMRICYDKGDFESVCGIVPSMPCKHVIAICLNKADIEGDDQKGFRVEYRDGEQAVKL